MQLPTQVYTASEWRLHDFQQRMVASDPAAGGVCSCQLPQVPQDELWLIDRMVVSSDSSSDTTVYLYLDGIDPTRAIDGTWWGNFDVGDMASPIHLAGGTTLLCEWTGASSGTEGILRVQYQLWRRAGT